MTCIVGLVHKGTIWMGGDSAGVYNYDMMDRVDPKVFVKGRMIFGFTSSWRMGQLLQYKFSIPSHMLTVPVHEYMATDFIDSLRTCLKEGGFAEREKESETGGQFLVGYEGKIFNIFPDYQVAERREGYDAVGCGYHYALGSLASTDGDVPNLRVRQALMVSEHFSGGVRAPFLVLSLPPRGQV